jgi:hypothetical protein
MIRSSTIAAAAAFASIGVWLGAAAFGAAPSASSAHVLATARDAYGRADWDHLGVLVETGTDTAAGLHGSWRLAEDMRSGRRHETDDFGVNRSADVWDEKTHWQQDQSGGVHALNSAFARSRAVTEMWLARRGFLRTDAAGARIEYLNTRQADGRIYEALRATPAGGQPVELWFDATTGLLARTIRVMPTATKTIRYEDYRRAGAVMIPFKIVNQDDDFPPDIIAVDRAAFTAQPADGEFAPPQTPDDSTVANGVATVPVTSDGFVVFEARLNGKGPFGFILDTGGHDILTPEAAKALGLKMVGAGESGGAGAGTVSEQYTRVGRVEIGGVTLRDQAFYVDALQYDTVEMGAKPPLAGIMGLELFERFAMELNYRAQTLTFRPLKGAPSGHGIAVPIAFTSDMPIFTAKIDGLAGDNGLDTGNGNALVVQGRWAQANGLAPRMREGLPTAGFGAGGVSQNWAVRTDVEVAGKLFPHVVASYSEDKKGAFSSRTEAGNIGNQIYSNFTLGFDYGRNTVWFDPLPGPPQPATPYSRAGMSMYKKSADAFSVVTVLPNSPATEAGIAVGDDIVAVNGVAAKLLSGWDMRHIVRKPAGTKLTLDVVHAGKKRSAVVTLRELLP